MSELPDDDSPRPLQDVPHNPFGILLSRDLFFGSKVTGTAQALGLCVEMIGDVAATRARLADGGCRCVLVDLALPALPLSELMSALPTDVSRPKVIAFGAHVQTALLDQARTAGCDEVMPRSKFSSTLPDILRACIS